MDDLTVLFEVPRLALFKSRPQGNQEKIPENGLTYGEAFVKQARSAFASAGPFLNLGARVRGCSRRSSYGSMHGFDVQPIR